MLGGVQVRHRRDRIGRGGGNRSAAREHRDAPGLRHAAGGSQYPLARRLSRAGSAAARLQGVRGARVLPGEPAGSHRVGQPEGPIRHRHDRQVLRRHPASARRPRNRRARRRGRRHPPLQGGDVLAARAAGGAPLRRRARRDPRRRGKAPGHRVPDQGRALQLARGDACATRGRQVRRQRRMVDRRRQARRKLATSRSLRAVRRADRQGARSPLREARARPANGRSLPGAPRLPRVQGKSAGEAARGREPTAVLLLGLPAQHFDPGSRGQPRHGRHRLPLHGGVDGPQHFDVHAHGRRRRALDRAGAVHRVPARVRQPRRRHLLSLGAARDPRRGRSRRQHDLQDPLQRRGGHDRRPALRRSARPGDDLAPDRRRGRATDRRRRGREGIVAGETRLGPRNDGPAARGPRRGAARAAREERRFGDHLRADLRHREAPAQKAQGVSRSRQARGHQRDGL